MKLKFKKLHPDAVLPTRANPNDAGMDITTIGYQIDDYADILSYSTGLAVEIPEGHVGLIFPRSSVYKYTLSLSNCVGVIDVGFLGEIKFKFRIPKQAARDVTYYNKGDRIGQLIVLPYPKFEPIEVDELDQTNDRGGGFGSSGQ